MSWQSLGEWVGGTGSNRGRWDEGGGGGGGGRQIRPSLKTRLPFAALLTKLVSLFFLMCLQFTQSTT